MLRLLRTFNNGERDAVAGEPALLARGSELRLRCADAGMLMVLAAELDGLPFNAGTMRALFGADHLSLQNEISDT